PASCLLKSALRLFLRKPNQRRQRELFIAPSPRDRNYFYFGAASRHPSVVPARGTPRRSRRGGDRYYERRWEWIRYDTPPALRYPHATMLTLTDSSPEAEIFDAVAVAAELDRRGDVHAGDERELRLAVSRRLRAALARGRAAAERLLIADRHGRRCAERLSLVQDEIIRVLFEFAIKHLYPAQNPSE